MDFIQFVRKPFAVEAVLITEDNLEEVAKLVGFGGIKEDAGGKYILLNRRLIPNVSRANVGWWLTRLGENYRCYAPKVFEDQFIEQQSNPVYLKIDTTTPPELGGDFSDIVAQTDDSDPTSAEGITRKNVFDDNGTSKEEARSVLEESFPTVEDDHTNV